MIKLRHIAGMMEKRDRQDLLPRELRKLESALAEKVEELWQTRQVRASKKQVADEVDMGIYFLRSVIVDVVIDIYEDLQQALERFYPDRRLDGAAAGAALRFLDRRRPRRQSKCHD